jgi:hypothetical protein
MSEPIWVSIEILGRSSDDPPLYSTAISYTAGLSIEQVQTILAGSLLALEPEGEEVYGP